MSLFLLKALAIGLTVSQILTQPDVKTSFSPTADRALARKILKDGCFRIREIVGEESPFIKKLDPSKFLDMQIKNAQTLGQSTEILPGIQMSEAKEAYELFCTENNSELGDKILMEVIGFYNLTLYDLPDIQKITSYTLKEYSHIKDADGQPLGDIYRGSRRNTVPLSSIPENVKAAFLAAEDRNFYSHKGVDERGVLRAGLRNMMSGDGKREQGGSTITQQLVKNLLLDDKATYERKLREMVLAHRLEKVMSKDQILELYLNYVFLGRSSWGVDMAAQTYFGKSLKELTHAEAALLAGLPKGPGFYNPDKNPERSIERTRYVLDQMEKSKFLTKDQFKQASQDVGKNRPVPYENVSNRSYFFDAVADQVKGQFGIDPRETSMVIQSTQKPAVQEGVDLAIQEGLAQYELDTKKARFLRPETNLRKKVEEAVAAKAENPWLKALQEWHVRLPDVRWPLAMVVSSDAKQTIVGLKDGTTYQLRGGPAGAIKTLKLYDVVYVRPHRSGKSANTAELRFIPQVQAAAIVMENSTGRIVGMSGGFSHYLSSYNRAVRMLRQPGSVIKPLTYWAALTEGIQPNTLILDNPVTIAPLPGQVESWNPDNYGSTGGGERTLRWALEQSRNRVTARLAANFMDKPVDGFNKITAIMKECGFNPNPQRFWPVILGAQETTLMNIATCYATIANGGWRPKPHLIRRVNRNGKELLNDQSLRPTPMTQTNSAAVFQLRSIMQGVVARGTANGLNRLLDLGYSEPMSEFIAGKTGTSQASNDVWFAGFSADLTVVVWVGYDNGPGGQKKTLGRGTGGSVALPIFAEIWKATLEDYPPRRFGPPPSGAVAQLREVTTDRAGNILEGVAPGAGYIREYLRVDSTGSVMRTRNKFVREEQPRTRREVDEEYEYNQQEEVPRYDTDPRYADPRLRDPRFQPQQRYGGAYPINPWNVQPQPPPSRGFRFFWE